MLGVVYRENQDRMGANSMAVKLPIASPKGKRRQEYVIEFKQDCTLYFSNSTVFAKKGSKVVVVERKGK